jgi:hypothetical protein
VRTISVCQLQEETSPTGHSRPATTPAGNMAPIYKVFRTGAGVQVDSHRTATENKVYGDSKLGSFGYLAALEGGTHP